MLSRSRVTGAMDVQRLGEALARPGMDPRIWCSLAAIKKFHFDENEGPFCDVVLMPSGTPETVRVGAIYAGPGFGLYLPVDEGDEVLVAFPMGDPDHGGIIVARQWSPSDPPPSEANANQADLLLHVKKDKHLRIVMEGGGNAVIKVDSGKVLLGDETGTDPVANGSKTDSRLSTIQSTYDPHTHTIFGFPTTPPSGIIGPLQSVELTKVEGK